MHERGRLTPVVRTAIFALSVALVGCAKHDKAEPAAAPPTKQQRCEAIGQQMARVASATAIGLAAGLDDGGGGMSASERAGLEAELSVKTAALVQQCATWDDEVLDCFGPFAAMTDKCERALTVAFGGTVTPTQVTVGPTPRWTADVEPEVQAIAVTAGGRVIVATEDQVVALDDGAVVWTRPLPGVFEVAAPPPDTNEPLLALTGTEAVGLDIDSGAVAVSVTLPPLAGTEADEYAESPRPVTAAREGEHWLVGDSEARMVAVDLRACTKSTRAAGCTKVVVALPDEYFDRDTTLIPLPDGTRLLVEDGALRHVADGSTVRFEVRARDSMGRVVIGRDSAVFAMVDHDLLALNLQQCRSPEPIAPSDYPQPGRMYFKGADECPECTAAPRGCVTSRGYVEDASGPFAVMANGTMVVPSADGTRGLVDGKQVWGHELSSMGAPVTFGSDVLVVGDESHSDGSLVLWRLGPDGTPRTKSPLPSVDAEQTYWSSDLHVAVTATGVVLAVKSQLLAFEL